MNFADPSGMDDVPVGPCPEGQCGVTIPYPSTPAAPLDPFFFGLGGYGGGGIRRPISEFELRWRWFLARQTEPQQPASNNEGQPLSDCVKNILAKYFDRNLLDAIRIHNNSTVPPKMSGYTYYDNVYFSGQNNQRSRDDITAIGHEVKHAQQYRTHTLFLAQYVLDIFGTHSNPVLGTIVEGDFLFGKGNLGHDMNRFEKPAMKRERQINIDLATNSTPCP